MRFTLCVFLSTLLCTVATAQDIKHYELPVGDFHILEVTDDINVDYICDAYRAGKVEYEAPESFASAITFSSDKKGKLTIELADRDKKLTGLPTVKVYSTFLSKAVNEGDSTVRVLSVAPGATFNASLIGDGRLVIRDLKVNSAEISVLSGKGTIVAYGTAASAYLSVTGAGQIQADDLMCQNVRCTLTGTGNVFCYPTERLDVKGIGSIKVYYRGTPEVHKSRLSNAKIISLDAESGK
ncbi:MAG: DUF2807 domain-containing protein [Paramuribaculum sp.]|nr:DUF2807 domain-containing protein [Paramuribaculum sp.]